MPTERRRWGPVLAALMVTACRRDLASAKPDPAGSTKLVASASASAPPKEPGPEPITKAGALHGRGLELRDDGDIYTIPDGQRLTTRGRALALAITIDMSMAVFLRAPADEPGDAGGAEKSAEAGADELPTPKLPEPANGSELWVLREGARPARRSVVSCEPKLQPFGRADLSPDGKTFYFTLIAGGPGNWLVAADVETGAAKFQLPSVKLLTMRKEGPDAGQLIVSVRRSGPPPMYISTDVVALLSPAGKVLRELGDASDPKVDAEIERLRFPGGK